MLFFRFVLSLFFCFALFCYFYSATLLTRQLWATVEWAACFSKCELLHFIIDIFNESQLAKLVREAGQNVDYDLKRQPPTFNMIP